MANIDYSKSVESLSQTPENDIDLKQITRAVSRNKGLIAKITSATLVLSTLYAFLVKPVWEGQFQIVLESVDAGNSGRLAQIASQNPGLANLAGLAGSGTSQLETEVKVLRSPSVLKPTYEFVKASKVKAGEDVSNWTFQTGETKTFRLT